MDARLDLNKSLEEQLSPEEMRRIEHMKMHEKHKGHDAMHAEMLLILIITIGAAQIGLVEWKRRHHKSYQLVTLAGMWIIPVVMCIRNQWWRFIFLWLLFSCITGLVVRKAIQKPIQGSTPRLVYKWFYFIYKLSYALGIIGYVIMMCTFFGLNIIFDAKPQTWMDVALLFIFYGLYYGVLGQDLAEISSDKMASHIGYYTANGIPTRHLEQGVCAVCGNRLLVQENEEGVLENTYKLSCDHVFHEFCIRGWCIVGKKQTCPYCKEKVDLKKMFCNPTEDGILIPKRPSPIPTRWEKPHVLYGQLLDWIRWLVAWQPVILGVVQGINYVLGLE